MGWLWMCLGGAKSVHRLRVNGEGELSSDTHVFPALKTPRVEDFLQPRRAGYGNSLGGDDSGSPASPKSTPAISCNNDANGNSRRSLQAHVDELEEQLEAYKQKLAFEAEEAKKLREEVSYLRSCGKSLERETPISDAANVKVEWNPYWGNNASEATSLTDKAHGEDRRQAIPSTRKSFYELLIGTDCDETSTVVKGPLARAATAALAERAARSQQYGATSGRPRDAITTGSAEVSHSHHQSGAISRTTPHATAECRGSLVDLLLQEKESILQRQQQDLLFLQRQQRILLDVSKSSSGGRSAHLGVLSSKQEKADAHNLKRSSANMSTTSGVEPLDVERIAMQSGEDSWDSSTDTELTSDYVDYSRTPGFLLSATAEAFAKELLMKSGKRPIKRSVCQETSERRPRSPPSPHSIPLLAGTINSSLSDHSEAQVASAVAAFKEGRLQANLTERSMHQNLPRACMSQSRMSIRNLFRSSRKPALALKSRAFRRPLSPVPEAVSHDEGLLSRRSSNCETKDAKHLCSDLGVDLADSLVRPDERGRSLDGISRDGRPSEEHEKNGTEHCPPGPAHSGLETTLISCELDAMISSTRNSDDGNQQHRKLVSLNDSIASHVTVPRPSRGVDGSTNWTLSADNMDLQGWNAHKMGSNQSWTEIQGPEADSQEAPGSIGEAPDACNLQMEVLQEVTELRCQSSNSGDAETGQWSFSKFLAEHERQMLARQGAELRAQEQGCGSSPRTEPQHQQATIPEQDGCDQGTAAKGSENHELVQYWNSPQKATAGKQMANITLAQHEDPSIQYGILQDEIGENTGRCGNGSSTAIQRGERMDRDVSSSTNSTPDGPTDASSSTPKGAKSFQRDGATAVPSGVMRSGSVAHDDPFVRQVSSDEADSHQRSQAVGAKVRSRTPQRDPQVAPEVFISPNGTKREVKFTRLLDIKPEDRPIFGSIADHWEAAWASRRQTWDGKGIPNSTNKYKEDQKVSWHATPFEERLARALATQGDVSPRKLFNVRTNLAACNDRGLEAH